MEREENGILGNQTKGIVLEDANGNIILEITHENVTTTEGYKLFVDEYEENIITCKDCGKSFEFTLNEQRFYEEKGFTSPVRCKVCRDKRKQV